MSWKSRLLKNFRLYAVTDLSGPDPGFLKKAEQALRGGVDVLQLRSKALRDGELLRLGAGLRSLTRRMRKLFIVNNRPDLAFLLDADGVHLGQEDLPPRQARKILKAGQWVGISTHSLEQAVQAEKDGADYIGVGPVFSTPTKPAYQPVGLKLVKEAAARVRIPFVAIGGIDEENAEEVLDAGASRIAVVRAVWKSADPFEAAKKLKGLILRHALPVLQV